MEFQEVMKQWAQMCHSFRCSPNGCSVCPLVHESCYHEMPCRMDISIIESKVMAWAAEHPEPVYPTWIEWLKSMGVVPYMMGLVVTRGADDGHFHDGHVNITAKALEAIPADIAQKLGIEPKEG